MVRGEGPRHGDWLRNQMRLPPEEQERRLEQDPYYRSLPTDRQIELRGRLKRFNAMPPEKRQRVLDRMDMIERMPPEQQRQTHELFHQFRGMDPERKDMVRRTLRQMRTMPPDARERFLNSPTTQTHFSPEEMQMLRGFNALGFAERDR